MTLVMPDLIRASITLAQMMDCRIKSGNDDSSWNGHALKFQIWSRCSVMSRAPRWNVMKSQTHLNATAILLRAPIRK